jgi:hypothetical protein
MKSQKYFILKIFISFLILSFIEKSSSISLFSEESNLYYNKPKTYMLDLKESRKKFGDSILGSIIFISVHNENEKSTKIKLLSKLNSPLP